MLSSRKKPQARCPNCQMRLEICLCDEIKICRAQLNPLTKIYIIMHVRESRLTTNTGRLAHLAIPNCEIRLRGMKDAELETADIFDSQRTLIFLSPEENSVPLTKEFVATNNKPMTLIVPDGSWRQAAKVYTRETVFSAVPRVHLELDSPSQYKLRREPKPHGLATFEAISRALGLIEGAGTQQLLDQLFSEFVERTLRSRGVK